jgi:hypothetical protein
MVGTIALLNLHVELGKGKVNGRGGQKRGLKSSRLVGETATGRPRIPRVNPMATEAKTQAGRTWWADKSQRKGPERVGVSGVPKTQVG